MIPFAHGRRLYEAAPPPKTFVALAGGHGDAFERGLRRLLRRHRPLSRAAPARALSARGTAGAPPCVRRHVRVAFVLPPGTRVPLQDRRFPSMPRTASRVVPDIPARLRTALGDRYLIEEEIGRGGAATVYLAEDLKHARKVAIKVLRPDTPAGVRAPALPPRDPDRRPAGPPPDPAAPRLGRMRRAALLRDALRRLRDACATGWSARGRCRSTSRSGSPGPWPARWRTPTGST